MMCEGTQTDLMMPRNSSGRKRIEPRQSETSQASKFCPKCTLLLKELKKSRAENGQLREKMREIKAKLDQFQVQLKRVKPGIAPFQSISSIQLSTHRNGDLVSNYVRPMLELAKTHQDMIGLSISFHERSIEEFKKYIADVLKEVKIVKSAQATALKQSQLVQLTLSGVSNSSRAGSSKGRSLI